MDSNFKRGQIVTAPHVIGQFEHAREHGRHQLAVGDFVGLHELQIQLGVKALHDDRGRGTVDCETDGRLRRCMIKRCRREIDHAVAVAPKLIEKSHEWQGLRCRLLGRGRNMPFGRPVVPEE